jgi:hypothetical protein
LNTHDGLCRTSVMLRHCYPIDELPPKEGYNAQPGYLQQSRERWIFF